MSGQSWPGTPAGGQAASAQGGGVSMRPVLSLPNTDKQHDNAVQDAQLGISQVQAGISQRGEKRTESKNAFEFAAKLRDDYNQNTQVKAYEASWPMFIGAIKSSPNKAGDQLLVTAFAKLTDPTTGVLGGERKGVAEDSQSWVENQEAQLNGIMSSEGGVFSEKTRASLRSQLLQLMKQRNNAYNAQRVRYEADAKAYGIAPERVIGPHVGAGDTQLVQQVFSPDAAKSLGMAKSPEQRGGLPVGTGVQFGMDGGAGAGPFDRSAYIQKQFGITPDQETNTVAFWNQNAGNKALTPAAAKAWYQQNGIAAPDDGALGEMVQKAQAGSGFGPIDTSGPEQEYRARLQSRLDQQGFDPNSGASYADRFTQGALLGNFDELYGVQGAVGNLFDNKGVADGYVENRDTARLAQEQQRQAQGVPGQITEFVGGLAPGLMTGGEMTVANAAQTGAAMGGAAGFGYGEGLGGSVGGGITGAALGGVIGGVAQKGINTLVSRRAAMVPSEGADVIQAADRLNNQFGTKLQPLPADVGGPTSRAITGASAMTPLGVQPIVKGAENITAEAKLARDAIAGLAGTAQGIESAGGAALDGAVKFIKNSGTKVKALYTKAKSMGGSEAVDLVMARNVLDDNIAELEQIPGGTSGLARLKALRETLNKPYPVEGVKGMRTSLRDDFASDGLRGSDIERRVGLITDAAQQDIVDSLNRAGKSGAAKAYSDAAAAHKERVGIIDNILAPIIGAKGDAPKSGEQIMTAIGTATKQNNVRLGKFLSALPAEDANTVRATLISRLGYSSKGTQNAEGDAFSLPQFLTHWNDITKEAKTTLFGGELRAALDDLAKVAQGTKEAQRFENVSRTGNVVATLATGGLLVQATSHPLYTIAGLAAQYGLGHLMASPRFARWLARVPTDSAAMPGYVAKLSNIAAADSAIAADALGLQRQLHQAFGNGRGLPSSQVPLRAAAQTPGGQADAEKTKTAAVQR